MAAASSSSGGLLWGPPLGASSGGQECLYRCDPTLDPSVWTKVSIKGHAAVTGPEQEVTPVKRWRVRIRS